MRLGAVILLAVLSAAPVQAEDNEVAHVAPSAEVAGTLCEWKAEDGLAYRYRVPASYDASKGANLTFLLHGSNLNRWWGFANHSWKTFRPDDIVVSPDGTTAAGNNQFNFMGNGKDAKRKFGQYETDGPKFREQLHHE